MPRGMMAEDAPADGADGISNLPDGVLQHVLGFLESDEAVRTSVLARRWSGLWRFMPSLRVTGGTISSSRGFVDNLLNLRGCSTLHKCVFSFYFEDGDDGLSQDDVNCLNRWIRHALMQQVQKMSVGVQQNRWVRCSLDNLHIISQSLTKLQLTGLDVCSNSLDFTTCPALKELNLTKCCVFYDTDNIYSTSLACLRINECCFMEKRIHVSTPNLVLLEVTDCLSFTPVFEYMPALVAATVIFNKSSEDYCFNGDPGYCVDASCAWCYPVDDGSEGCVVLRGVSEATNLKLISAAHMFILKRDLRFCPTFSKLKTLLLNGWCVVGEQCALACILQHSPLLENLTIDLYSDQLYEQPPEIKKQIVPSKAVYNSVEQSVPLENLNTVEVKYHEVNWWIFDVMKSLITYGIPLQKISIQQKNGHSEYLNFTCVGFSLNQS